MRIIRNNIIPIKGFKAINLFGVLFVRGDAKINDVTFMHESIHTAQMKELLYVFFYILYLIDWLIGLVVYGFDTKRAYREICFEKEAYENERNNDYLKNRKAFVFKKYIIKKK